MNSYMYVCMYYCIQFSLLLAWHYNAWSIAIGKSIGQKPPPLSVTIKKILERYPDGQITKVPTDEN